MFDEIDPHSGEPKPGLSSSQLQPVQTITISCEAESTVDNSSIPDPKRIIHFYTETTGDLYLAQGHPRLAAEVYRTLNEHNHTPRLAEKLAEAQRRTQPVSLSKEKKKES